MNTVSRTLVRLALPLLAFTALSTSEITCGVSNGYDRGKTAYFFNGDGSLSSFDKCSSKCQADSQCKSFAFSTTECLLYSDKLDTNFRQQSDSPYVFYDRECRDVPVTTFTTLAPSQTPASAPAPAPSGSPQAPDSAKGEATATTSATTMSPVAQLGASLTTSVPTGTASFTDAIITSTSKTATTKSVTSKSTSSKLATSKSATASASSSSSKPSSAASVVHIGASSSLLLLSSLLAALFA